MRTFKSAKSMDAPHALVVGLLAVSVFAPAFAAPVAITSYSIGDAVMSGYGGWQHAFTGTITPIRNFTNGIGGPPGVVANYDNGSGTLNDGIVGTSPLTTELFVSGDNVDGGGPIKPVITLTLAKQAMVRTIKISGGDFDFNLFPGQITGVTAVINGQSVAVNTTSSGLVNFLGIGVDDIVDLTNTPLSSLSTDTVVLKDFIFNPITFNQFSITELTVDGLTEQPPNVVDIDVKPQNNQNTVCLNSDSKVWVALLSSSTFDARKVDPSSLTFGRTGKEQSLVRCKSFIDVNGDNLADLECQFFVPATGLALGDSVAILNGSIGTGPTATHIIGSDDVNVVVSSHGAMCD
jgi:hypothetical protein